MVLVLGPRELSKHAEDDRKEEACFHGEFRCRTLWTLLVAPGLWKRFAVCLGHKPGDVSLQKLIKEVTMNTNYCWGFEFSSSLLWLECFPKCWRRSHESSASNYPLYQSSVININPVWGFVILKTCNIHAKEVKINCFQIQS